VSKLSATVKLTLLYTFKGLADGGVPSADLIRDAAGNLYGSTGFGGDPHCLEGSGCGVLFKLGTTGKQTVLHTFTGGADGGSPGSLILDAGGNLYGAAAIGGANNAGVLFKLTP
jgi:uncharacterized repeat protein (TIGR03803 family)